MAEPRDYRQADLFRPALEAIIDMGHPLVRLAGKIDWGFLDRRFGEVYAAETDSRRCRCGSSPVSSSSSTCIRSATRLCARAGWRTPFQYFCGERVFRHALAFDRSSLTRWRRRLGEERLSALLQESLRVAHETEALATKDLERVAVDTTVQPKRSPIRPTPGSPTRRSRSSSASPSATASRSGRAI